jgi:hypothetical protein
MVGGPAAQIACLPHMIILDADGDMSVHPNGRRLKGWGNKVTVVKRSGAQGGPQFVYLQVGPVSNRRDKGPCTLALRRVDTRPAAVGPCDGLGAAGGGRYDGGDLAARPDAHHPRGEC